MISKEEFERILKSIQMPACPLAAKEEEERQAEWDRKFAWEWVQRLYGDLDTLGGWWQEAGYDKQDWSNSPVAPEQLRAELANNTFLRYHFGIPDTALYVDSYRHRFSKEYFALESISHLDFYRIMQKLIYEPGGLVVDIGKHR